MLFPKIYLVNHFRSCTSSTSVKVDIFHTLNTHLQISSGSMNKIRICKIDNDISKISQNRIIKNCIILKNRNICLQHIEYLGKCLMIKPSVLRSRIDILQELGLTSIGLNEICRFPTLMRKSLMNFKNMYNMPTEKDIMQTMFSNVGASFNHLEWRTQKDMQNMRIGCYYKLCVFTYKISYLQLQNETYDPNKRYRYYSLTEISKLAKFLTEKCGFDVKFLQKYPELLHLQVCDVEELLNVFRSSAIFNKQLVNILRSYPRLLFYSTDKLKKFLHIQKELQIPILGIRFCPNILKMDTQKFLQRYSNIGNSFDLGMWVHHPRVISMIYRYQLVERRRQCLSSSKIVSTVSINTYLTNQKHFLRFVSGESDHVALKKYLKYILVKELGHENMSLVNCIEKHPHWKYISLRHMNSMLKYLKANFSNKDICANIQIILYPWSKVAQVLNLVKEEYIVRAGYNFTPKQYLALCLYELEKKHHFSGDAVWQHYDPDLSSLSSNTLEDVKSDKFDNYTEDCGLHDSKCISINEVAWLEYFLFH